MANILVIDDEQDMRDLINMYLSLQGHQVTLSTSGNEGFVFYQSLKFDLIITDIVMPNGSGIELINKLQTVGSQTPVIAMSGGRRLLEHGELSLSNALAMGVAQILEKPFDLEHLCNAVTIALQ
jgi:DNA-binding NtrC family response regulator